MKYFILPLLTILLLGCGTSTEKGPQTLNDWFWTQRAFPGDRVNSKVYHEEKNKVIANRNNRLRNPTIWTYEGPNNIGGRITDIELDPGSIDLIWVGSASGGAFKSEDQGGTWEAMTELQGAPPIGDICVRPGNPKEVWIGTGESNGASGSIAYEGFGVLRSRNGGRSWENMGLTESGSIGRIALDPVDPATIFVAAMGYLFEENAERGIFRSKDGGATWENVLFLNNKTGGSDIIIDPVNPNIIYASMWERIKYPDHKVYWGTNSGVYKSIDGGDTWSKLDIIEESVPILGRIGIAMAPTNPSQLYTLVTGVDGKFKGIYKTYDKGEVWTRLNQELGFNYRSAGYWYCNLTVDPENAEEIFVCGLNVFRVYNDGNKRATICEIHVDQHSIVFHPANPKLGYIGNDGGLYRSENKFLDCSHYKNLPITQFYTCTLDPIDKEILYGGTQDNNPLIRKTVDSQWKTMLGGDGFVTLPDPRDNTILYSEYQYGNIHRSINSGEDWYRVREGLDLERSNWNTPFMFSPMNADVMFLGSHRVHRTDNGGEMWYPISEDLSNGSGGNLVYGTITSIDVSPLAEEVMIAGTDDGNVWITISGGVQWELVSDSLPDRWVTSVVCDPKDVDRFYISYSGLKWHDYIPHLYRSDDVGENWEDIGEDLPEIPVNDIIIDPDDTRRIWLATDLGVFESIDDGEIWNELGEGLPIAIVNDIDFNKDRRKLLAGTYGRSMWSIDVPRLTTPTTTYTEFDQVSLRIEGESLVLEGPKGLYRLEIYRLNGQIEAAQVLEHNSMVSRHTLSSRSHIQARIYVVKDDNGFILTTLKSIR